MNNKFKKATKRITAVAASALMVSSAAFAGLSSYPANFEKNNEVTIVTGAAAMASDSVAAATIVLDLEAEFEGSGTDYIVTATKNTADGDTLNVVTDGQLNFGEILGAVTETGGFDDQDTNLLEDGRFDNNIADEDYTQILKVDPASAMEFNYALKGVSGVDDITDGIYVDDGTVFAEYTLEMDNSISLVGADYQEDLIGSDLVIMGNEFTVGDITRDGSNDTDTFNITWWF